MLNPSGTSPIYGLLAQFASPEQLRHAALSVRAAGYDQIDGFTPFPVEGMDEVFPTNKKLISFLTLLGGIFGGLGGFYLQHWIEAVNYPLNVGGRPYDSIPAFIPVVFELTVLGAATFSIFGMLALNRLPQPYHPVFNVAQFSRASRDQFFLCVHSTDPKFDSERTRDLLESLEAVHVFPVPY